MSKLNHNRQIEIPVEKTERIGCADCGHAALFHQVFGIRKISRLLTGSAEDSFVPQQEFVCVQCSKTVPTIEAEYKSTKLESALKSLT